MPDLDLIKQAEQVCGTGARLPRAAPTARSASAATTLTASPSLRLASSGAAGYVTPGMRIEIVDEMDRALPAGTEGIVRILSEYAIDRYVDDAIESAKVFRNGYFYPGDLGTITPERLLVIAGREKAVINVGGNKLNPETIETVLQSYPGVSHAGVFCRANAAGIDEVWAVVAGSAEVDIQGLRSFCAQNLPALFVPNHIVKVSDIPRNDMGRIVRSRLDEIAPSRA